MTSVKDEAPYLIEWVAYYRAIGVSDITVFWNDCSDGTARMLGRMAEMGLVRSVPNPVAAGRPAQRKMLRRLERMYAEFTADWLAWLDIDEFVNVHCGNRDLDSLIDALGEEVDAISLSWKNMGSAGWTKFIDRPVVQRFDRCGAAMNGSEVKTLFRPARFERAGLHRPHGRELERPHRWVNGSGCPVAFDGGRLADPAMHQYGYAQINHYAVKSRVEYVNKQQRGSGWGNHGRHDLAYWDACDCNDRLDRSIPTEGMLAVRAELMADRALAGLHRRAVALHRARARRSASDPAIADFLSAGPDVPRAARWRERDVA